MVWLAAIGLLAVNVLLSVLLSAEQSIRLGPLRFPAASPHKPFLLLNGALVLYILFARRGPGKTHEASRDSVQPWGIALVATALAYLARQLVRRAVRD